MPLENPSRSNMQAPLACSTSLYILVNYVNWSEQAAIGRDACRSLSGRLWPDGSFSVGIVPRAKKSARDKRFDHLQERSTDVLRPLESGVDDPHGFYDPVVSKGEEVDFTQIDPLTLSPIPSYQNSPKARAQQGLKGITSYGKKMVRSGAQLLQDRNLKKNLSFLTLTVPPVSLEAEVNICSNWGSITADFFQWLQYHLKKRGRSTDYVGCTEVQEHRLQRTGEPGLHIHALFNGRCKDGGEWVITPSQVREEWRAILQRYGKLSLQAATIRVGLERVKKSAAAYIGKYLSKGSAVAGRIAETRPASCIPRRWWFAGSKLAATIRASVRALCVAACKLMWNAVESGISTEFVYWSKVCTYRITGEEAREIKCGVVGRLSRLGISAFSQVT